MTSHSPYLWHRLQYARHHILTLWPQNPVFMSSQPLYLTSCALYLCHHITVLLISHQMYFWDHIRYSSQYHIHCIRHDTHCMTSQPLLSWHQIRYISHHLQDLWHVVPYSCDITDTMFVIHCIFFWSTRGSHHRIKECNNLLHFAFP